MKIIGLTGQYRCGKTTLGRKLEQALPNAKHFALADHLKTQAVKINPELKDEVYAEEKSTETRLLLRNISKIYKTQFGQDYYLQYILLQAKLLKAEYCIISDVRFMAEFDGIWRQTYYGLGVSHQFICLGDSETNQYDIKSASNTYHNFCKISYRPNVQEALDVIQ